MVSFKKISGIESLENAIEDLIDFENLNFDVLDEEFLKSLDDIKDNLSERIMEEENKLKVVEEFFKENLNKSLALHFKNPDNSSDVLNYNVILNRQIQGNRMFYGLIEKLEPPYFVSLESGTIDLLDLCRAYDLNVEVISAEEFIKGFDDGSEEIVKKIEEKFS